MVRNSIKFTTYVCLCLHIPNMLLKFASIRTENITNSARPTLHMLRGTFPKTFCENVVQCYLEFIFVIWWILLRAFVQCILWSHRKEVLTVAQPRHFSPKQISTASINSLGSILTPLSMATQIHKNWLFSKFNELHVIASHLDLVTTVPMLCRLNWICTDNVSTFLLNIISWYRTWCGISGL